MPINSSDLHELAIATEWARRKAEREGNTELVDRLNERGEEIIAIAESMKELEKG